MHRHRLAVTMAACIACSAMAQDLKPSAAFVQLGGAGSTYALAAGALWDWSKRWTQGAGELSGYWEVSVSQWSYRSSEGRTIDWLLQLGVKPVFRWRPGPWFFDAGIKHPNPGEDFLQVRYVHRF